MTPQLSEIEARVVGCLIEKQIATPDQYPLTLHSLVAACNQKSNRDPVLALAEHDVQAALSALTRRDLVLERFGLGNRVPKYQQLFCNTEFGSLRFSPLQTAIVCELLLRGPQTPGELRTRAARLAEIKDPERGRDGARGPDDPARRPVRRQAAARAGPSRLTLHAALHRCGATGRRRSSADSARRTARPRTGRLESRIEALEQAVEELRRELAELRGSGRDQ